MARSRKKKKLAGQGSDDVRYSPPAWPKGLWAWGIVLLACAGAAGLHVRSRLATVRLGYALSESSSANRKLRAEKRKLQVEVATLRSPRHLRRLAIEKLGMVEPTPQQIVRIGKAQTGRLALSDAEIRPEDKRTIER